LLLPPRDSRLPLDRDASARPGGPPFVAWALLWLLGGVIAFVNLAWDFLDPRKFFVIGRDFSNLQAAGWLADHGRSSCVFDVDCFRMALLDHIGLLSLQNYSYPPHALFIAAPFGLLPYPAALALWTLLGIAFFAWAARPHLPSGFPALLAPFTAAGCMNIWAGHYGFLFGALWLAAWHLLERRPRTAGLLIGLMIVKPHLALLMPFVLARRGDWTAFLFAALTASGLVLVSGLAFGWDYWASWVGGTLFTQAAMIGDTGQFFLRMMPTVAPSLLLAGLPSWAAWAAQAICGLAALAALWRFLPKDPVRAGLATACATLLVLPYAFVYDMTVVSLAALLVLYQGGTQMRPFWRAVAALAFLLPVMTVPLNGAGVPLAPLLTAFTLFWTIRLEPIPRPG